jgi:DNA-binding GntR family transcriptional regulator
MVDVDTSISDDELPPAVNPIGPHRTVEQLLVRELRESIIDGRLRPGVRLPYRELARQFNVSVTPVRIALRELSTEGLVELRPHGGATVAPLSFEELEEVFSMRVGLESWLARIGAAAMTDDDIALMQRKFVDLERAAKKRDHAAYLQGALDYRLVCYQAAGRPRLCQTLSQLFDRSARYTFLSIAKDYRFDQSLAFMKEFGEGCRRRDGEKAEKVIREALEWSLEYVSQNLRATLE